MEDTPYLISHRDLLKQALYLHEKMNGCYFWSSPAHAASRRAYEDNCSFMREFELLGHTVFIDQTTSCSCKNIYYKALFVIDGKQRDIRGIKKLLKEVDKVIEGAY